MSYGKVIGNFMIMRIQVSNGIFLFSSQKLGMLEFNNYLHPAEMPYYYVVREQQNKYIYFLFFIFISYVIIKLLFKEYFMKSIIFMSYLYLVSFDFNCYDRNNNFQNIFFILMYL